MTNSKITNSMEPSTKNLNFRVNSNSGEAVATLSSPADGLTAAVIEKYSVERNIGDFLNNF